MSWDLDNPTDIVLAPAIGTRLTSVSLAYWLGLLGFRQCNRLFPRLLF